MIMSSTIRRGVLIAAVSLAASAFATPAVADPADDLVVAMGYNDYYTGFSSLLVETAVDKLKSLNLSAETIAADRPKIEADAAAYRATFLGSIAKAYRARFSPEELQQLAKFYGSPLGKKIGATQQPIKDDVAAASTAAGMYVALQTAQLVKK